VQAHDPTGLPPKLVDHFRRWLLVQVRSQPLRAYSIEVANRCYVYEPREPGDQRSAYLGDIPKQVGMRRHSYSIAFTPVLPNVVPNQCQSGRIDFINTLILLVEPGGVEPPTS
jgi:hypothetical protein